MLLVALTDLGSAQDSQLADWLAVPSQQAGLVLVLNSNVSVVTVADQSNKPLSVTKWGQALPFVQQYRMEPGVYQIRLGGLISSVSVVLKSGALTYLRLSANPGVTGEVNINASTGRAPTEILNLAEDARSKGIADALKVNFIQTETKVLLLNTDPPWPVPPPPKR